MKILDDGKIIDVKGLIQKQKSKLYQSRQSLRLEPKGKSLNDSRRLIDLVAVADSVDSVTLYLRDLGPQIGWRTVFLVEYTGPLVLYFILWLLRQPWLPNPLYKSIHSALFERQVAMACWCGHYIKRVLETLLVHRFSHATMPRGNLFKNCSYYFGFAAFVAYFTNHPLYTPPYFGATQFYTGLVLFLLGEFGNFSCHLLLKRLRPPGTTVRRIPTPLACWPLTRLFNWVACPNYTYEAVAWIGFTVMTQTLPAALFTLAGFIQMSIWAKAKLRAYRSEFPSYPKGCKAIVPVLY